MLFPSSVGRHKFMCFHWWWKQYSFHWWWKQYSFHWWWKQYSFQNRNHIHGQANVSKTRLFPSSVKAHFVCFHWWWKQYSFRNVAWQWLWFLLFCIGVRNNYLFLYLCWMLMMNVVYYKFWLCFVQINHPGAVIILRVNIYIPYH